MKPRYVATSIVLLAILGQFSVIAQIGVGESVVNGFNVVNLTWMEADPMPYNRSDMAVSEV
eukprot:gene4994-6943_t